MKCPYGVERGQLGLRRLPYLAEHLRRRRLVEPDLAACRAPRGADPAADPDRLQHAQHAEPGDLAGELRLLPGHRHVRDRSPVINLVRLDALDSGDETALVKQVTADQPDVADQLPDTAHSRVRLA